MGEVKYINTGLKTGKRDTDYRLGSSPVKKEVLNESLDWKEYAPEHEIQARRFYDTMSCVTYSATDCIEYIFNHAIKNNRISKADLKWLKDNDYFKNGMINFNERFTAILGETDRNGAWQYKVGDAIRKYGLVPQDAIHFPDRQEDYFKNDFNQNVLDLGLEFIKRFPINYQWANNFRDDLKYGPLQVTLYFLNGDGILCPKNRPQHAVVAINANEQYVEIDDSYLTQFKKYCHGAIYSPMLYTVNFKNNMKLVKSTDSTNTTVFLIDELGQRRVFFNEKHFNSVAPALGLAEKREDGDTDWSQVELMKESDIEKFPLANPLYEVNG